MFFDEVFVAMIDGFENITLCFLFASHCCIITGAQEIPRGDESDFPALIPSTLP